MSTDHLQLHLCDPVGELRKELTATLLLSPTGLNTLATQVWSHTSDIEFASAAPYAALLILVSGLPVYLLTTRMYLSR